MSPRFLFFLRQRAVHDPVDPVAGFGNGRVVGHDNDAGGILLRQRQTAEMPEPAPAQAADAAAPINQAELLRMLTESPEILAVLKMLAETM